MLSIFESVVTPHSGGFDMYEAGKPNESTIDVNSIEEWVESVYHFMPDVAKVLDVTEELNGKIYNQPRGKIFKIIYTDGEFSIHIIDARVTSLTEEE
jgi:hypothetical protein